MWSIIDRAVKPVVEYVQGAYGPQGAHLPGAHMSRLGIRNTRRLAHVYNGIRYRKLITYREAQYRDHFQELIQDNGPANAPIVTPHDGWAIDTSGKLPHLQELLADADEVIRERGETQLKPTGSYRSYFQNILRPEDLQKYPSFLNVAVSSEVLSVVSRYVGSIPALSSSLPPGVRFTESSAKFDNAPPGKYRESQLFHIDYYALPLFYVIVLLRDVDENTGPFCFLPISESQRVFDALDYWARGKDYRLTDEEVYSVIPKEKVHPFAYPKGTVLFIDSSRCLHYGSRDAINPRYQMMYAYSSVRRTDFSDEYLGKMKFPARTTDSRLRKMLLNKNFLG